MHVSDPIDLAKVKDRLAVVDSTLVAALAELRGQANKELKAGPFSIVTNNKPRLAPSGDKHDYVSMAPYFWPDPAKKDGLPYIRKDGQVNPEREKFDCASTGQNAAGCAFAGPDLLPDRRTSVCRACGQIAARLVPGAGDADEPEPQLWPVHPRHHRRPRHRHYRHSSARSRWLRAWASCKVRRRGPRPTRPAWKPGSAPTWRGCEPAKRRGRGRGPNNHGSWYDAQLAAYFLFVGERESAKKVLQESKAKRIARQIEPDGASRWSLNGPRPSITAESIWMPFSPWRPWATRLVWIFGTSKRRMGAVRRKALDWLIPFATGEKKWEHQQIKGMQGETLAPFLRRAAVAYREPRYEKLIEKLPGRKMSGLAKLLYPGEN